MAKKEMEERKRLVAAEEKKGEEILFPVVRKKIEDQLSNP